MSALLEPTAACLLEGRRLDDGWEVVSLVDHDGDRSGGACSVGYLARHDSGVMGFVKAFDYAAALDGDDPARELERITSTYNAERDLLEHCGKRGLRRVVRALSSGTYRVTEVNPSVVNYLIFELADGDARDLLEILEPGETVNALELAHHAAVGLSQLHSMRVAHQDLKPSNLLVWTNGGRYDAKVGDLGCAHVPDRPAPHDTVRLPGDPSYAPPELLYDGVEEPSSDWWRGAADLYMLGNLVSFLLTGVRFSGIVAMQLNPIQRWTNWDGTFEEVLPGLIDAHGLALEHLRSALHGSIANEVVDVVDRLCHPDPKLRGDRSAWRSPAHRYSLEWFVSRLNLLARRAALTTNA